jgi:glycosyltransferase involved in cell wall biosynthesis
MAISHAAPTVQKVAFAGSSLVHGTYPLRVAYDAHTFISPDGGTGKGAQLRNLLNGFGSSFVGLAPVARTIAPLSSQRPERPANIIQHGSGKYLIWQQTTLPRLLAEMKPDIFLAPCNTAPLRIPKVTRLISVVHDLILLENHSGNTLRRRLIDSYRAKLLRSTIKRSSLILTGSHFTASQIMERYPQVRVRVIPCTVGSSWYVRGDVIPPAQREPYILIVTNFLAHKNAAMAMEAFARYRALDPLSTLKLRMVGVSQAHEVVDAFIKKHGLPRDSVVIEPFLSEADLQRLYRRALCVIVPSRMEGFGIPALEAMASGTPLVCSNTWSLPEVGGDAPLYFDPTGVGEMAQTLFRVCTDSTLRGLLIEKGLRRSEIFHPDRIQAQVVEFWRELPELYKSWKS